MNKEKLTETSEIEKTVDSASIGKKAMSAVKKELLSSAEALKKAKEFVKRYQSELAFFSGDSSIRFNYAEGVDTFSFGMPGCIVTFPVDWMKEEKFEDRELEFVTMHELSHFIDMRDDPEGYLNNFDRMEKKAKKLAKERLKKHPEDAEKGDLVRIYFEQLHLLYNCLDDVYVNSIITSKEPYFGRGDGKDDIVSLYGKMGFKKRDLTKQPLHRQMAFALLGDDMVGEKLGASKVDPKVEKVLSEPKLGRSLRTWTKSELKTKKGRRLKASDRYEIIRKYFENDYLKLVEEWIDTLPPAENQTPPEGQEGQEGDGGQEGQGSQGQQEGQEGDGGQEGQGNQGQQKGQEGDGGQEQQAGQGGQEKQGEQNGQEGQEDEEGQGSQENGQGGSQKQEGDQEDEEGEFRYGPMDPRNTPKIEDIRKRLADIRKGLEEGKKTQAEKDKEAEKEKLKEKGLTDEQIEENDIILDEIDNPRRKMQKFWRSLIGKAVEHRKVLAYNQRRGELSPTSIIDNYADLVAAQQTGDFDSAGLYEDYEFEKVEVNQPERIEVTLLVDCSGSMRYKTGLAKQAVALLLYSLDDFNRELIAARGARDIDSNLQADSQVILFAYGDKVVKDFRNNKTLEDEKADIVSSVSSVFANGSTDDLAALHRVNNGITDTDRERIKAKKLKKIVFEITDGGSDTPMSTRDAVLNLGEEGVLMVGFYIGGEYERGEFDKVWDNEDINPMVKAVHLGDNIESLPEELMEQLASALGDITI